MVHFGSRRARARSGKCAEVHHTRPVPALAGHHRARRGLAPPGAPEPGPPSTKAALTASERASPRRQTRGRPWRCVAQLLAECRASAAGHHAGRTHRGELHDANGSGSRSYLTQNVQVPSVTKPAAATLSSWSAPSWATVVFFRESLSFLGGGLGVGFIVVFAHYDLYTQSSTESGVSL